MRRLFLVSAVLLSACDGCSEHGEVVDGPYPFVRCASAEPPEPRRGTIGEISYRLEERTLTLEGLGSPARIGAFRGAGDATEAASAAVAGLAEQGVGAVFVLGGLGGDVAHAQENIEAAAGAGAPTVILVGGEDDVEIVDAAFEAARESVGDRIFDGRRLRLVRLPEAELLLASGAPSGRYAANGTHCGLSGEDLESLVEALGPPDEAEGARPRFLLSWAAPRGEGPMAVDRGFGGVPSGAPEIAELARDVGAMGGVFAWPATRALLPAPADGSSLLPPATPHPEARITVPPVAGVSVERQDGSFVRPAATVLEIGAEGLAYMGNAVPGRSAEEPPR